MTPLAAIAIPTAAAAATQLVQQLVAQRPFVSFFSGGAAKSEADSGLSPGDVGAHVGGLLQQLRTAIANRLEAAGLDPGMSFDLSSDTSGRLVVGDHPQREEIAAALAGDEGIRNTFQQISSLQSLMDAAKRHLEFAKRYAIDPLTTLPGADAKPPFSLSFAAGELQLSDSHG